MSKGRSDDHDLAAGGPAHHIPVLADAAVKALAIVPGQLHVDGTFGAGGYARAMLAAGADVIGLDRDPRAITNGAQLVDTASGHLRLVHTRFGAMRAALAGLGHIGACLDGIVLDVGVSSMQIDEGARGFSFRFDGPLDMRMSGEGRSAADILREASADELADIFFYFGEERASRRIARAIVADRESRPYLSTLALAQMIGRVCPAKPHEIHPATRVFQALRIAVNDELGELVRALEAAEHLLKPGGRLVVVTFHSLEDRIVKQFLSARSGRGMAQSRLLPGEPVRPEPTFDVPGRQPVLPDQDEMRANPRARSAKMRFGQRTQGMSRAPDEALALLGRVPHLPSTPRHKGR